MRRGRFDARLRSVAARALIVAVLCAGLPNTLVAGGAPIVAAASDLKFALDEIAAEFGKQTGQGVNVVYGASGNLTRQLTEGAPYELFLSADEGFIYRLADAGLVRDRGVLYAVGRLVIFAPRGSPLTVDPELNGLRDLVARGALTRFAIANPQHAPYGRAAEAALRAKGLWQSVEPRLVLGESVAQAAQFATMGDAVGGLLAHSLVLAPPLRAKGTYALLPEALHPPLRQRMVLTLGAGAVAERFFAFLQQPPARAILAKYGFSLPHD
jgi:molybdate transport system substrate-binding protein